MSEVTDERGVRIDYVVDGAGRSALVLHGAYSTRDEVRAAFGPVLAARGRRGVYPDLPGMGASRPTTARTTDDVLGALDALVAAAFGDEDFVVIGHSYGAHLAAGVAVRHPTRVRGLALCSPLVDDFEAAPHRVVLDDGRLNELDEDVRGAFTGYFVVRTERTRKAFEQAVRPSLDRADDEAVDRVMTASARTPDPEQAPFAGPALLLLGRDDDFIGWRAQMRLGMAIPRATVVVVDGAGHALPHERPELVRTAVEDWLDRVELS